MPAEWEKPIPLNTLLERGRTVAEYGRALAERVPYSLVALVSRFAVASVFWRSGAAGYSGQVSTSKRDDISIPRGGRRSLRGRKRPDVLRPAQKEEILT